MLTPFDSPDDAADQRETGLTGENLEAQLAYAKQIALRLLTRRDRSVAELRSALAEKSVPEAVAEQVLSRFGEVGLINDTAFAQALVDSGQHHCRSRREIALKLQKKGLEPDAMAAAWESLPAAADHDAALRLAQKKTGLWQGLDRNTAYRKLGGFLYRRGFDAETIASVLHEVLSFQRSENDEDIR
ncbi:MAG: recombination regulator RecX [Propionibacteriaceae bacterium]|nr:recombination regulator RecX [Propionibacteriaceae bacterium]